ncbi:MAG: PA14 domain-containing protein [Chloroflexota bacterium]
MRIRWPILLSCIAVLLLMIAAQQSFPLLYAQTSLPETAQKGFGYAAYYSGYYSSSESDAAIAEMKAVGANSMTLLATIYQNNVESTQIYKTANTPTNADLAHVIQTAHSLGIKVNLKVHIDLAYDSDDWRGEIGRGPDGNPRTDTEWWTNWFASYRTHMLVYAQLAEDNGVEYFTVGTELEKTVVRPEWRPLIQEIDGIFSGELMYAANHGNEGNVTFWDLMDYIGIDAYYHLTNITNPTKQQIKDAWTNNRYGENSLASIDQVSASNGNKPVVLTEIGYRSVDGSNMAPWCYNCPGAVDLQEQVDLYEVLFEIFSQKSYFEGAYLWVFDTEPSGPCDTGYTPFNKPAENVVRRWYGQTERAISSTCSEATATPTPDATATNPPPLPPAGSGSGQFTYEWWGPVDAQDGISGLTSNERYPDSPIFADFVSYFEMPRDEGDFYGARLSGYVHPPVSGNYTFWIAGDDVAELHLSTDATPANLQKVAEVTAWTETRNWNKYPTQKSVEIALLAGQKYYIEALMVNADDGSISSGIEGSLSVAWAGPGFAQQLITGQYLSASDFGSIATPVPTPTPTAVMTDTFAIQGFGYAKYGPNQYNTADSDRSFENMADTGANWVSLLTTWYQENRNTKTIYTNALTPLDADLTHAINKAHAEGLKVLLKPHVNLQYDDDAFRGRIGPEFTDADWNEWFASYANFINHYATFAEANGVDMFAVGTELVSSAHRKTNWETIIAGVKERYSGPLTYAANHTSEDCFNENGPSNVDDPDCVQFWGNLDYIGIDGYYNLTDQNDPTVQEIKEAWIPARNHLAALANKYPGKPIIFTELGYRSWDGANRQPWCYYCRGGGSAGIDLQEQVDTYQALLEVFHDEAWFGGIFWWDWTDGANNSGTCDDGYSPHNKPAENLVRAWFGAPRRAEIQTTCINPPTPTPSPTPANVTILPPPGGGAGYIDMQWWTNISSTKYITGFTEVNPNYPDSPSGEGTSNTFEGQSGFGDYYGTRLRGYLHPPVSGTYYFYTAGDDVGELWMSTVPNAPNVVGGTSSNNMVEISSFPGWANPLDWSKYPSQKSVGIELDAANVYYVEGLHVQRTGGDRFQVGWEGPGFTLQLIDGQYLSPYTEVPPTAAPTLTPSPTPTLTPTPTETPIPQPGLTILTDATGAPGSHFMISGINFGANEELTILVNDNVVTPKIMTDSAGKFTFSVIMEAGSSPDFYSLRVFGYDTAAPVALAVAPIYPVLPPVNVAQTIMLPQNEILPTPEITDTPTPSPPTATPTPTLTATPVTPGAPTHTPTITPTITPTATETPTSTPTTDATQMTPTQVPTATPTSTRDPRDLEPTDQSIYIPLISS